MAKSKKAMSKSLKSTGDAWRAHVANVAKTEGVKYGKAMSLASKGKYGAEWKKIKAGMGSSKKAAVGGMALAPASINQAGGEIEEVIEEEEEMMPTSMGGSSFKPGPPMHKGGKRRTRKARKSRGRKGKRGGALALLA